MAASKDKTVLFATAMLDKKIHTHAIAVFNDTAGARQFAAMLRLAYRSGDVAMIRALNPKATFGPEDAVLKDTKFSAVTVPYAPSPELSDDDALTTEPAAS
jgi:hypothetical protein